MQIFFIRYKDSFRLSGEVVATQATVTIAKMIASYDEERQWPRKRGGPSDLAIMVPLTRSSSRALPLSR